MESKEMKDLLKRVPVILFHQKRNSDNKCVEGCAACKWLNDYKRLVESERGEDDHV